VMFYRFQKNGTFGKASSGWTVKFDVRGAKVEIAFKEAKMK